MHDSETWKIEGASGLAGEGAPQAPTVPEDHEPVFRQVDPRFIPAERVSWWIFEGLVYAGIIVGFILMFVLDWFVGVADALVVGGTLAGAGLLRFLSVNVPRWVYDNTSYALSPRGIEIRRGILWKRQLHVPRSRIQHTDVTQGPLQRRFGISSIKLHTAGTVHHRIELSGLKYETALQVRDDLLRRVGNGDDDAV